MMGLPPPDTGGCKPKLLVQMRKCQFKSENRISTTHKSRPAGRCLQLVRPIGGKAGRKGGHYHHVR